MYRRIVLIDNLNYANKMTGRHYAKSLSAGEKALVVSRVGKSLREVEKSENGIVTVNLVCYGDYNKIIGILRQQLQTTRTIEVREQLVKLIDNLGKWCYVNDIPVPGGNPVLE